VKKEFIFSKKYYFTPEHINFFQTKCVKSLFLLGHFLKKMPEQATKKPCFYLVQKLKAYILTFQDENGLYTDYKYDIEPRMDSLIWLEGLDVSKYLIDPAPEFKKFARFNKITLKYTNLEKEIDYWFQSINEESIEKHQLSDILGNFGWNSCDVIEKDAFIIHLTNGKAILWLRGKYGIWLAFENQTLAREFIRHKNTVYYLDEPVDGLIDL
jgi:hypothetical protein